MYAVENVILKSIASFITSSNYVRDNSEANPENLYFALPCYSRKQEKERHTEQFI
ncbi:hypothetical protein KC19_VG251200 [Ceratodon purpureus]|uniref:Uncharacterized protein n=1 Tax=Ceratodon purpureus TaxID=3225 RepID=A0A8T0HU67_CERPU|nr:hypothetical protein KC19_VG251200 [Ceratodon purpureus]